MAADFRWKCLALLACTYLACILATDKPKKKDIRDYNDADMARLLEQWEVCVSSPFLSLFLQDLISR